MAKLALSSLVSDYTALTRIDIVLHSHGCHADIVRILHDPFLSKAISDGVSSSLALLNEQCDLALDVIGSVG